MRPTRDFVGKIHTSLFLFLLIGLVKSLKFDVDVEYQCIQRCPLQNQTDEGHYELDCAFGCSISKCVEGCKLWRKSLESSCQSVCNGTLEPLLPQELYCVIGCNDATTRYFSQLRGRLGTPPAPALVADSLTATSLSLEWNFPEAKDAGLAYFVQWRYEELAASWQYCRNHTWGPHDTVFVDNLQPYTKYRFRVALLLSQHSEPIVSAPSVVISTLPAGVPASPPSRVRAVAIDSSRISVSWEPGPFPHGPLLSFVLRITENHPNGYSALKDIPAEKTFYMFRNLEPSRNYTVSIAMRNGVGAGPSAKCSVSTPPSPIVKEDQQPVLVLGADHVVIEQGTDMLEEPILLYKTNKDIKGVSIHINQKLLFISDDTGKVLRMPLAKFTDKTRSTIILSPPNINFKPIDLSVDWLNNQLYILGEVLHEVPMWQVTRCNLDGRGLQVAVAGLRTKPHHIEVDPYNGFLFWVIKGSQKGGLYRLDLSDISNGIKHEVTPELILSEGNLGAFTVDHTNFRLLVSNQKESTINSVSLDGKEITNLRPKIIKSRMQNVVSLATANKTFYWTDGSDVLYEEYHPLYESYFHNSYPDLTKTKRPYLKVFVNLPSSQPTPIPVNPPTSLQVIFGTKLAKASWRPPHLLGGQGKGAWQNWTYEISIKNSDNSTVIYQNINGTTYVIENLEEDMEYTIKASAYTSLGKGPSSSEFRGRSLKAFVNGKQPEIIWSASEGLLKSDPTGDNVETLISRSTMKNYHFTDVATYQNQVYLVTNNSQIVWYDLNTHTKGQWLDIDSVGSIAVDWIGKKLYWSNPKQHLIIRGNLNGTQQEPLPILTLAKELNIDAAEAYLYWSTGHAVECSHLNGANKRTYHPAQLFSGKQVMGLTLDMDHKLVYWIVRSSEGANLFRAPMAQSSVETKPLPEKVSGLQKPNMQGPLGYFNNRLIWLEDEKSAVISDLQGKNAASISGKSLSGLITLFVMDSSQYLWPGSEHICVIPEPVERESVRTIGTWKSFNITWKPSDRVNYGTVFYEIKVESFYPNSTTKVTTNPYIEYWQHISPFTKLNVVIRAYTFWGTSPLVRTKIYSPPSTPSAPTNLRLYVTKYKHHMGHEIRVVFRWDPPIFPNGVIQGYNVKCWYVIMGIEKEECDGVVLKGNEKEYYAYDLLDNTVYYFQVQAFTEVGKGEMSDITSVNTINEYPLPKLLVASTDSIFIQDVDINENYTLIHGINTPIEIAYHIKEDKIFWINDMNELLMLNLINSNRTKILDLNGEGISLTMDWLERSLYYIQKNGIGTSLQKVDLNQDTLRNVEIFHTPAKIFKIDVSPFTRKLYWTEEVEDGKYRLMQSSLDGLEIKPFFTNPPNKRDTDDCNCPHSYVEKTFSVDHYDEHSKPILTYIDADTHNILTTDRYGCLCNIVANHNLLSNSSLQRLKSDFSHLYWTNSTPGLLYFLRKNDTNVSNHHKINAQDMLAFGPHMQPYPPNECLIPKEELLTPSLLRKTSSSLILLMPEVKSRDDCENISMATIAYTIYYKLEDDQGRECDGTCKQITTYDKTVTIEELRPFTKYLISLAVSNFYSLSKTIGPAKVFQTLAGTPSKPRIISTSVLNPTLAEIVFSPPVELNGGFVWYEVHWQTESTGIRQKGEQIVLDLEQMDGYYYTQLHKLSPNETYSVWVRAYSETNDTSSDSNSTVIEMFPEPENIKLVNSSAYELCLQWEFYEYAENFTIQYSPLISSTWFDVHNSLTTSNTSVIRIQNLQAKTQYKIRIMLKYPRYSQLYIWPKDSRFTFETLGDKPSPPGVPIIQYVKADVYQVWWEASKSNGASIDMYLLEGLKLPNYRVRRSTNRTAWYYLAPSVEEQELEWVPLYNGTDTYWIITGLEEDSKYSFRVSALNLYGWSNYSEESMEFDFSTAAQLAQKPSMTYILIATSIPVGICFVCIICIIVCKHNCLSEKTKLITPPLRGPDVELATLRELPRRGIHNTNVLYISTQITPDEIAMLPHINRDKIKLMKFLGSGAFGEVFEGKARNITEDVSEIPVAVKTLRKGASEQEKTEFLQEAQLMSHFKHEHILQLLGVCLDNDPHFIIMELMEGGDLLTYLRSSRKLMKSTLTLLELVKMCVDVARGCRYLEEMHFVHRDLACRNCLVSSTDPETRIVKIGDFGLARDIYKNDYYRKEGEGLLPVRWMAPESLVDGVFTCLSDVWAFGVLLWEIMTLGQQPYPARNNLEVLHYVKSGGRLGKPIDCPEKLHDLMLKCWSYEPERRPTFKYCLSVLEELYTEVVNNPVTGAHEGQYISTVQVPDGVTNQVYFQDENHNSGASWKSTSDGETDREKTPFLQRVESNLTPPQYLELLHNGVEDNDGYEIPRSSLSTIRSDQPIKTKCALETLNGGKPVYTNLDKTHT